MQAYQQGKTDESVLESSQKTPWIPDNRARWNALISEASNLAITYASGDSYQSFRLSDLMFYGVRDLCYDTASMLVEDVNTLIAMGVFSNYSSSNPYLGRINIIESSV